MNELLLKSEIQENIDIHIMMNIDNEWKQTYRYKLLRIKNPSKRWKLNYRKKITRLFLTGELD